MEAQRISRSDGKCAPPVNPLCLRKIGTARAAAFNDGCAGGFVIRPTSQGQTALKFLEEMLQFCGLFPCRNGSGFAEHWIFSPLTIWERGAISRVASELYALPPPPRPLKPDSAPEGAETEAGGF